MQIQGDSWGPSLWNVMHLFAATYPVKPSIADVEHWGNFYNSLEKCIPCSICREHYVTYRTETPINLKSRLTLMNWVFHLHNDVNKKLGKPLLPIGDFITMYANFIPQKVQQNVCKMCGGVR